MGPKDISCADCGYTLPGAASDGPQVGRARPIESADDALRHKPAPAKSSGIKIRRDDVPLVRADRADDHKHRDPDTVPTAGGSSSPQSGIRMADLGDAPAGDAGASDAPPPPSPSTPRRWQPVAVAKESSTLSTVALVAALLGCIPILPPVAVVLGILALREIKKAPSFMKGQGRAMFGIGAGALGTLGWIGVVVLAASADFSGLGQFLRQGPLALNMVVMEQLPQYQDSFRAGQYADEDGDGKGEFGTSAQLGATFDDLELTTFEDGAFGWVLHIELPPGVNGREQRWWAFMEPVGGTGTKPWMYIDESRILRSSSEVTGTPTRRQAQRWTATSTEVFVEEMLGE